MKTLADIEQEVAKLSHADQQALREWLEDLLEDQLVVREEFKAEVEAGFREISEGNYRVHRS